MLETDKIYSKPDAASWALKRLEPSLQSVVNQARNFNLGLREEEWTAKAIEEAKICANFLQKKCLSLLLDRIAESSNEHEISLG